MKKKRYSEEARSFKAFTIGAILFGLLLGGGWIFDKMIQLSKPVPQQQQNVFIEPADVAAKISKEAAFAFVGKDILSHANDGVTEDRFYLDNWTPEQTAEIAMVLVQRGYTVEFKENNIGKYIQVSWNKK